MTRRDVLALAAAGIGAAMANGEAGARPPGRLRMGGIGPAQMDGVPGGVLRADYASGVDGLADWALVWPPDGAAATWIVNLHGHGSHGDQLYTRPDICRDWLPVFRAPGCGILTPNLRDNAWMGPAAAADLRALLEWARNEQGARRFVFAGGSMGGASILAYAALHPGDVAGAIALCPAADLGSYYAWCRRTDEGVLREIADAIRSAYGGEPQQKARLYAAHSAVRHAGRLTMPLFVAHGVYDALIPVSQSRSLAAALKRARSFTYLEQPDGDHETPLREMPAAFARVMSAVDHRADE